MATKLLYLFVLVVSIYSSFAGLLGGWEDAEPNEVVDGLAMSTAVDLDNKENSQFRHKVVKIVQVKRQLVAGMKYKITMDIGLTGCRKNDDSVHLEDCQVSSNQVLQRCTATYWLQSWLKDQKTLGIECHPLDASSTTASTIVETAKPTKNGLLGGNVDSDPEDEHALQAARYAVEELNKMSNSLRLQMLMDVRKVSKQTVAGIKWKLLLEVGESSCLKNRKNQTKVPKSCAKQIKRTNVCNVEVVETSWMTPRYKLTFHKCADMTTMSPLEAEKEKQSNQVTKMDRTENHVLLGGDGHDIGNHGMFEEFKKTYGKTYESMEEEKERFKIFRSNMILARKLQDTEKGTAKYGMTKFADVSQEEFRKNYLTPEWDISKADSMDKADIPSLMDLPDSHDWRDHNAVTPVKNQGSCGSCWAFSTTGNIEGQWALKTKNLVSLSEQELVDCDKVDQGCNGGLPTDAYKAIESLGGLETEADYPYEGKGEQCSFQKGEVAAYINNSVSISSDEDEMKSWLYKNGPISIGLNANAMQFYMGGVSHPWSFLCNPESLDHGVLIVGYGIKPRGYIFGPTPYWIIKNSWGPDWGENGYYLLYRGKGVCGVNKMPTSAVVN